MWEISSKNGVGHFDDHENPPKFSMKPQNPAREYNDRMF